VFTYYCVEGTADPGELAVVGLFLHVDAHKRSWICRRVISTSPPFGASTPFSEEERDAFLRLVESAAGRIHGERVVTELALDTAVFLRGLDDDPPPRSPKETHSERDRFISETKYPCRVNDSFEGTALLVERIYDGRTAVWYGALELACSIDEFRAFSNPFDLHIRLEDGRTGVARVLWRQFVHVSIGEAGDSCLCHIVGIERLEKSAQFPAWLTPSR
jgi:hypothetical protein